MDGIHSVTHLLATLFEHMIKFLLLMSTVLAISLAICCAICNFTVELHAFPFANMKIMRMVLQHNQTKHSVKLN